MAVNRTRSKVTNICGRRRSSIPIPALRQPATVEAYAGGDLDRWRRGSKRQRVENYLSTYTCEHSDWCDGTVGALKTFPRTNCARVLGDMDTRLPNATESYLRLCRRTNSVWSSTNSRNLCLLLHFSNFGRVFCCFLLLICQGSRPRFSLSLLRYWLGLLAFRHWHFLLYHHACVRWRFLFLNDTQSNKWIWLFLSKL